MVDRKSSTAHRAHRAIFAVEMLGSAQHLKSMYNTFVWLNSITKSRAYSSERDVAFRTILRNRINRGGILAPGAGVCRLGENGRGLLSRWYPETLKRRILEITAIRNRVTFCEDDGIAVMEAKALGAVCILIQHSTTSVYSISQATFPATFIDV
jgi:hypothetical protein